MRFAVVEDTREWSEPGRQIAEDAPVYVSQVEAEARRRKAMLKLDEWRMREYVTGNPIPARIHQISQQIDFAAQALSRMSRIPADYADDLYWPRIW
jgi:tRNA(Met) C34 N-acetyltransferase TmcA